MATASDKYEYALLLIQKARHFNWQLIIRSGDDEDEPKHERLVSLLLSGFLQEARAFPESTLLDLFWEQVCRCHNGLRDNVNALFAVPRLSDSQVIPRLFANLNTKKIDWTPVIRIAEDLLRYIGIPFFHIGVSSPSTNSDISLDDTLDLPTPQLLQRAKDGERGCAAVLQSLALRRDGVRCVVTGKRLRLSSSHTLHPTVQHKEDSDEGSGWNSSFLHVGSEENLDSPNGLYVFDLAQIIPRSCFASHDFLHWIGIFAVPAYTEHIEQKGDRLCNVLNVESQAYRRYEELIWTVEAASTATGNTYLYRKFPPRRPVPTIPLYDGAEMRFGEGPEGATLSEQLPDPMLCNVRLAIVRALHASGAAKVLASLREEADDTDCPRAWFSPEEFLHILDAKLQLAGGSWLDSDVAEDVSSPRSASSIV